MGKKRIKKKVANVAEQRIVTRTLLSPIGDLGQRFAKMASTLSVRCSSHATVPYITEQVMSLVMDDHSMLDAHSG